MGQAQVCCGSPAPDPMWWRGCGKIVAIGRNYVAHVHELNNTVPKEPFWFLKPPSALIPSGAAHECPPGRGETHHELELGVVIGQRCRRVSADTAMDHVAGYCLALDMTDREGQNQAKKAGKPWTKAKGWDTSCPVSELVPVELVPDPTALNMWLKINDEPEPRQAGTPANMIFTVPQLISAVSHVHTLEPGDLLLTGTPEGVGPAFPGDTISAGISELGVEISVRVVASGEGDEAAATEE